jgi:hypothetical protein
MKVKEKLFTEEQLEKFDELTKLESSLYQMDRIRARIEWNKWIIENNITNEQLEAMKEELILQGRW